MNLLVIRVVIFVSLLTITYGFLFDFAHKFIERSIRETMSEKLANIGIDLEFSFPRTKWCGPGNTAINFDDLGEDKETDKCCREHDQCKLWVEPGKEVCGVENTEIFTISDCKCDQRFRKCLDSVTNKLESFSAPVVAKMYSSLITKCIRKDPRTKSCSLIDSKF